MNPEEPFMNTPMRVPMILNQPDIQIPSFCSVARAAAGREMLSHRLNGFLYAHLALIGLAALLPLLTPGDAFSRGAVWWLLHAVLYAVSLSSLLLGLSSAQAEREEFVWLLGQPAGLAPWLFGKAGALAGLVGAAAIGLVLPVGASGGFSPELVLLAAGAAGVSLVGALGGLAVGFWIRDSVRGLIATVALWFVLLFGADLLLLAMAGSPWVQAHPDLWVAPLMMNPLDAFRVTVLFAVEQAAFSSLDAGPLANWWVRHASGWLALLVLLWTVAALTLALLGARRRAED